MVLGQTIETNYFSVFYDEADNNIIGQITAFMDDTYSNIVNRFGLQTGSSKFKFLLCPNRESFQKLTGKTDDEYEAWMVGNSDYEKRMLCILSPNIVNDRSFDDMLSVVKHEIVHIAFDQLQNPDEANILIAEGIAVACAEQIDIKELNDTDYPDAGRLSDEQYFYENAGYLYADVNALHLLKQAGID